MFESFTTAARRPFLLCEAGFFVSFGYRIESIDRKVRFFVLTSEVELGTSDRAG